MAMQLIIAADRFQLLDLAAERLESRLDATNAVSFLTFADKYHLKMLKVSVLQPRSALSPCYRSVCWSSAKTNPCGLR